MIRNIILILFISLLSFNSLDAKSFRVNLNYLVFTIPGDTSYVELQFFVFGNTMEYVAADNKGYQAFVDIEVDFLPVDTNRHGIKRNYSFASQIYPDTLAENKENIYNVFRIPMSNGEYKMRLRIYDRNQVEENALSFETPLWIDFNRNNVNLSDIQLIGTLSKTNEVSRFTKYNIDYIPYFSNYYPETVNELIFMNEVYHTDSGMTASEQFTYMCYISSYNEDKPYSEKYIRKKSIDVNPLHVILHSFNIDSLPSGNYNLNIVIFDANDSLYVMKKVFFQRSNPSVPDKTITAAVEMTNVSLDTLLLYLDYIYAIADASEKEFIRNANSYSYKELDQFFLHFWYKRNRENPLLSWYEYYNNVVIANNSYSSLKIKGYKTDRGQIFLRYGAPNEIEKFPFTPEYYPYEIWYYYQALDQNNVMFIFYSRDLVTGFYELIHSTARNEVYNPAWKLILKAKGPKQREVDAKE